MLFCFTWIPEPGQGVGNGLPQFPIHAPGHSPLPALPAQGLSGFCSAPTGLVLSPCSVRGFTGAPCWVIPFLGALEPLEPLAFGS